MHIFREFPFDDRVTSGVNDGKQDIANLNRLGMESSTVAKHNLAILVDHQSFCSSNTISITVVDKLRK